MLQWEIFSMVRIFIATLVAVSGSFQVSNIRDERLSGTTWYLSYMAEVQPINPIQFRIRFDFQTSTSNEPMIFGKMICNYIFGKYASPITNSLNIIDWSSTTAFCLPPSASEREQEFENRMKRAATYKVEYESGHRTLTFYDASRFRMLSFITLNQSYLPIVTR